MNFRAFLTVALIVTACAEEPEKVPLAEWEVADLQAARYDFRAFPGAVHLEHQTSLLQRAHFILNPDATEAPPTLVLEADAPLEQVAKWYAETNGYATIAESPSEGAAAYYRSGDLREDALAAKPLFQALSIEADVDGARGRYRAAHISPTTRLPRVTLQRPWFDALNGRVVDSTLIVMVREEPQYFR